MSSHDAPTPAPGPDRLVLLFDGSCRFCRINAARLVRWAAPGAIDAAPVESRIHCAGKCDRPDSILLLDTDGTLLAGPAAIVRALNTRRAWRAATWVYRVPGLRALIDRLYRAVAANRHRLPGFSRRIVDSSPGPAQPSRD